MRLILICAAALTGLALGDVHHLATSPLAMAAVVAALAAGLAWRRATWRTLALMACAGTLGCLRASLVPADQPSALEPYIGSKVRVRGSVASAPRRTSPAAVRLAVDVVAVGPAGKEPPPLSSGRADSTLPSRSVAVDSGPRSSDAVTTADSVTDDPLASARVASDTVASRSPDAVGPARALVVADPGVLGAVDEGDVVMLEGRLTAADARGPPTLVFPKRLAREPATEDAPVAAKPDGSVSPGRSWNSPRESWAAGEGRPGGAAQPASPPWIATEAWAAWQSRLAAEAGHAYQGISRWPSRLRLAAEVGIHRYLPEPQASLASGVLLGGSGQLDSAFRLDLQRSGLAHLVAIDGFKQVVVAGSVGAVCARLLGGKAAAITSVLVVAGYTVLTGARPSAVRAGLMVGLASVAWLSGRVADPLTSVLVAAVVMATVDPRILLDVGLQLSLSATLGIILLWPGLRRRLRPLPRLVAEPIGLTVAVTLGSLPVTLSAFQQISLVSPLAHVLAVPLLPAVLVAAALLALAAPITPVGVVVAWLAWMPSSLLAWLVHFFGSLPAAAISTGRLPPAAALAIAIALLAWGIWQLPECANVRLEWRRWRSRHPAVVAPAACIAVCLGTTAALALMRPDSRPHIEPLVLSHGEAVFARGPTGHTALIVAGRPDASKLVSQVADHLAVWEHKLDDVVALEPSAEKALGLTLARYPADHLIRGAAPGLDLGGGTALDIAVVDGRLEVSMAVAASIR